MSNARKSKNWRFNKIVDDTAFLSVNKIHPLKQKIVAEIVDAAKKDSEVKRIIIFGSSTRYDCNTESDLDICIDWYDDCYDKDGVLKPFTANMRKHISMVTKGNADVVNYSYLDGTLIKDAVKEGVVVYEHTL